MSAARAERELDPAIAERLFATGDAFGWATCGASTVSPTSGAGRGANGSATATAAAPHPVPLHIQAIAQHQREQQQRPQPQPQPQPRPPRGGGGGSAPAAVSLDDGDSDGVDSDGGVPSDPEECLAQEERLEERVALLKAREGLRSARTLKQAFRLMDCLIGQYKLNRTDEILAELEAPCRELGGDWRVKYIQSTAFVRWKQYRFKEALALFLEQQKVVGGSAALCENIGHTYSSLGDLPKAEEYFERAIELLKRGSFGNKGGIYMGLGLVRDRMGKTRESIPILRQALEHYQQEHTDPSSHRVTDSSIIAKAHMSLGKAHEKMGEVDVGVKHFREALGIFRRTVGDTSPLTANAMASLGRGRAALGDLKEGISLLRGALSLEIAKDAFHLETVWEIFAKLKDVHMEEARAAQEAAPSRANNLASLQKLYAPYMAMVRDARKRLTAEHERNELGTLAVWFKTVGEMAMLAQDYRYGEELIGEALRLLRKIDNFDCQSLIDGCVALLGIAESNKYKAAPGKQPASGGGMGGGGGGGGGGASSSGAGSSS